MGGNNKIVEVYNAKLSHQQILSPLYIIKYNVRKKCHFFSKINVFLVTYFICKTVNFKQTTILEYH